MSHRWTDVGEILPKTLIIKIVQNHYLHRASLRLSSSLHVLLTSALLSHYSTIVAM